MNRRRRMLLSSGGSAPFSPSDIAGLASWYDASDTATITVGTGGVSQLNDKSGNGFHVVQNTNTAYRPQTGTRTLNGLNVLDFDSASTDVLTCDIANTTDYLGGENYATKFIVFQTDVVGGNVAAYTENTAAQNLISISSVGGVNSRMRSADGLATTTGIVSATNTALVVARIQRNTVPLIYDDGTSLTVTGTCTDNPFTPITNQQIAIGAFKLGFNHFNGIFAEDITYAAYLSAAQTNQVANYLADKWAATWVDI